MAFGSCWARALSLGIAALVAGVMHGPSDATGAVEPVVAAVSDVAVEAGVDPLVVAVEPADDAAVVTATAVVVAPTADELELEPLSEPQATTTKDVARKTAA